MRQYDVNTNTNAILRSEYKCVQVEGHNTIFKTTCPAPYALTGRQLSGAIRGHRSSQGERAARRGEPADDQLVMGDPLPPTHLESELTPWSENSMPQNLDDTGWYSEKG
jgi:hypothetical protein